jgi:hypothetical protein
MGKSSWSYSYKGIGDSEEGNSFWHRNSKVNQSLKNSLLFFGICAVFFCTFAMLSNSFLGLITLGGARASKNCSSTSPKVPQYFQTSPELWAGPTATGRAPFSNKSCFVRAHCHFCSEYSSRNRGADRWTRTESKHLPVDGRAVTVLSESFWFRGR